MNVLELYSGIGGMHYAFIESGRAGKVVSAAEINTIANEVYRHNFPKTKLLQRNIQSLTVQEVDDLRVDMVLMSPPCQPFTRVGLKKDLLDDRTCSFLHILDLLPRLDGKLKYVLVENVKGFEKSETRNKLVAALDESNFVWQELILSPTQFGIPNTRHRYYLIAKRKPLKFCFERTKSLMEVFPISKEGSFNFDVHTCKPLEEVIENDVGEEFLLPDKVLGKRAWLLDIVTPMSTRSCCFTKAYGHYVEGTGSVLCCRTPELIAHTFQLSKAFEPESKEQLDVLRSLNLRYFSPQEVARLMCFPARDFTFPDHAHLTRKQKYRLLGNSINVHVVSKLIAILTEGDTCSGEASE